MQMQDTRRQWVRASRTLVGSSIFDPPGHKDSPMRSFKSQYSNSVPASPLYIRAESSPKGPRTHRSGITERAMQQCSLRCRARSLHREVTRGEVAGTVAGSSPTGLRLFSVAALAPASGARQGYCTCPGYSGLEMLVKCVQGPLRYINVVQCPPPQKLPTREK